MLMYVDICSISPKLNSTLVVAINTPINENLQQFNRSVCNYHPTHLVVAETD